jgi:hypothetical protein
MVRAFPKVKSPVDSLAGGELLDHRVQVLHLLRGKRARLCHHSRHQQRYAEGFDAVDFAHVVSPWSGKCNCLDACSRSLPSALADRSDDRCCLRL